MSTIQRAYKTELDPNETQRVAFLHYAAGTRFVWNQALALRKKLWRQDGLHLRAFTLNKLLTLWKQRDAECWPFGLRTTQTGVCAPRARGVLGY